MPAPQHRMPNLRQEGSRQANSAEKSVNNVMMQACEEVEDMVRENPASAALITFGIGVGLGVALTALMRPARRQPMLSESTWSHIRDAVSQALPDALSQYVRK